MRKGRSADRLRPDRVQRTVSPSNPDYARIYRLASMGVEVIVDSKFRPSGIEGRPPFRTKYLDAGGAVDRMIYEAFLSTSLAVALPVSMLERYLSSEEVLKFIASSWAKKYGKACSHDVVDCGDGGKGSGLNSDEVRNLADDVWEHI